MRIVIIGQEEPVYFGPFLRGIIEAMPKEVVLVVIAGSRGAGSHPKTFMEKLKDFYILWLIMEPYGFLRNLFIRLRQKLILMLGPFGKAFDRRSIQGAARKHKIPILYTDDVNSKDFILKLKELAPDVVINQSELLLKEELLAVPKVGFLNRHGSLLPHFRGRLGSFWSHANEPPEYGVSIHFVDKEIDSGPIIVQRKFDIDPRVSYTKVLDLIFKDAVDIMLEALDKIKKPGFTPMPNEYQGTQTYLFPTLEEAKSYRKVLKRRRKGVRL